jgi:hypothetical protein
MLSMLFFWIITSCGLVGRYQRFGGTYCLYLQGWRWKQYVPPKRWYLPTSQHGVTSQKTTSTSSSPWEPQTSYNISFPPTVHKQFTHHGLHGATTPSCWYKHSRTVRPTVPYSNRQFMHSGLHRRPMTFLAGVINYLNEAAPPQTSS